MSGEYFRHTIVCIETTGGQILNEACAIDAAENLVALRVHLKRWPCFHKPAPENIRAVQDHAIGADFDAPVDFGRRKRDDPENDSGNRRTGQLEAVAR